MGKKLLTNEQTEKFLTHLKEKEDGDIICPVCKKIEWQIVPHLISTPIMDQKEDGSTTFVLGGETYSYTAIMCKTCGYTMLFNSVFIGLPTYIKEGEKDGD